MSSVVVTSQLDPEAEQLRVKKDLDKSFQEINYRNAKAFKTSFLEWLTIAIDKINILDNPNREDTIAQDQTIDKELNFYLDLHRLIADNKTPDIEALASSLQLHLDSTKQKTDDHEDRKYIRSQIGEILSELKPLIKLEKRCYLDYSDPVVFIKNMKRWLSQFIGKSVENAEVVKCKKLISLIDACLLADYNSENHSIPEPVDDLENLPIPEPEPVDFKNLPPPKQIPELFVRILPPTPAEFITDTLAPAIEKLSSANLKAIVPDLHFMPEEILARMTRFHFVDSELEEKLGGVSSITPSLDRLYQEEADKSGKANAIADDLFLQVLQDMSYLELHRYLIGHQHFMFGITTTFEEKSAEEKDPHYTADVMEIRDARNSPSLDQRTDPDHFCIFADDMLLRTTSTAWAIDHALDFVKNELDKGVSEKLRADLRLDIAALLFRVNELQKEYLAKAQTPQDTEHTPQDTEHTPQDTEYTPQDTEYTPQDTEHTLQNTEHTLQNTEHTLQDTEHTLQDTEHTPQDTKHTPQDTKHTPQDTEYTPQDTEHTPQDRAGRLDIAALLFRVNELQKEYLAKAQDTENFRKKLLACETDFNARLIQILHTAGLNQEVSTKEKCTYCDLLNYYRDLACLLMPAAAIQTLSRDEVNNVDYIDTSYPITRKTQKQIDDLKVMHEPADEKSSATNFHSAQPHAWRKANNAFAELIIQQNRRLAPQMRKRIGPGCKNGYLVNHQRIFNLVRDNDNNPIKRECWLLRSGSLAYIGNGESPEHQIAASLEILHQLIAYAEHISRHLHLIILNSRKKNIPAQSIKEDSAAVTGAEIAAANLGVSFSNCPVNLAGAKVCGVSLAKDIDKNKLHNKNAVDWSLLQSTDDRYKLAVELTEVIREKVAAIACLSGWDRTLSAVFLQNLLWTEKQYCEVLGKQPAADEQTHFTDIDTASIIERCLAVALHDVDTSCAATRGSSRAKSMAKLSMLHADTQRSLFVDEAFATNKEKRSNPVRKIDIQALRTDLCSIPAVSLQELGSDKENNDKNGFLSLEEQGHWLPQGTRKRSSEVTDEKKEAAPSIFFSSNSSASAGQIPYPIKQSAKEIAHHNTIEQKLKNKTFKTADINDQFFTYDLMLLIREEAKSLVENKSVATHAEFAQQLMLTINNHRTKIKKQEKMKADFDNAAVAPAIQKIRLDIEEGIREYVAKKLKYEAYFPPLISVEFIKDRTLLEELSDVVLMIQLNGPKKPIDKLIALRDLLKDFPKVTTINDLIQLKAKMQAVVAGCKWWDCGEMKGVIKAQIDIITKFTDKLDAIERAVELMANKLYLEQYARVLLQHIKKLKEANSLAGLQQLKEKITGIIAANRVKNPMMAQSFPPLLEQLNALEEFGRDLIKEEQPTIRKVKVATH